MVQIGKIRWVLILAVILISAMTEAAEIPLPLLPPLQIVAGEIDPLKPILEAYRAGRYEMALFQAEETLSQLSPHDPLAEALAFLIGDIHMRSADIVGTDAIHAAISAFQGAIIRYPQTENAIRGLVRLGEAYRALKFYPESIASFRRVLMRHPKSRWITKAKLGMGETYRIWGKIEEAEETYRKLSQGRLSSEERQEISVGEAGLAYRSGNFTRAYPLYRKASQAKIGFEDRDHLFAYGESAFRTGHHQQAREAMLAYYNTFPRDPLAPVAIARVGETWRVDKKDRGAERAYTSVRNLLLLMKEESIEQKIAKLISEVGSLSERKDCVLALAEIRPIGCVPGPTEKGGTGLPRNVKEVVRLSRALMQEPALAPYGAEALFSAAQALRRQGFLDAPLAIEDRLLAERSQKATPFHKTVLTAFQKNVKEVVAETATPHGDSKIAEIYYRYPRALGPAMLYGETGMRMAESLTRLNMLDDAARLYEGISANVMHPLAEAALARLGQVRRAQGGQVDAHRYLTQSLAQHPTGPQSAETSMTFGDLLVEEGEIDLAIAQYNDWLRRHAGHSGQNAVRLSLAASYVKGEKLKEAAAIYQQLLEEGDGPQAPVVYLGAADVYRRLQQYKEAVKYYERALEMDPDFAQADWANMQLAYSYRALGQVERSQAIFGRLAEKSADPVIQQMATAYAHPFTVSLP